MTRTTVGILRGGTSSEYALSLKTGAEMMQALPEESYDVRDILIDKTGLWHLRGQPATPARALAQLDVVLNAIHGGIGEDGTVQRMLMRAGIPYAGSVPQSAALSLNKVKAREELQRKGVRMPRAVTFSIDNGLSTGDMASAVFSQFGPPYIVKPSSEGASHGIGVARSIVELPDVIGDAMDGHGTVVIEEYVLGDEASVGVIEHFRDEDLYALPPAHVLREGTHLLRSHHEEGALQHSVPSRFSFEHKLSLTDIAKHAHKSLGLSHFSRSDFIVTPRAVYLLEVNSVPGLYKGSSFPVMLESVGSSVREFLEHAIVLAQKTRVGI